MDSAISLSQVEARVAEIIAEAADVSLQQVKPHRNLFTEIGMDSMDVLDMAVSLRKEYARNGLVLPEDKEGFLKLDTPAKVVDYVFVYVSDLRS